MTAGRLALGLAVLATVGVLAIVVLADRGVMPGFIAALYAFPQGDKVGHVVLMGALAFFVNLGLKCRTISLGRRKIWLGSLLVVLAVTLEEASQAFFPHRSASWADLACSYLGILTLGSLARPARRVLSAQGK